MTETGQDVCNTVLTNGDVNTTCACEDSLE